MPRRSIVDSLRPGWGKRPPNHFVLIVALARVAIVLFVLHASGAAHLLSDVLLDADMTCVDELARKPHDGLTSPVCPASESIGHGQAVALPDAATVTVYPSAASASPKRPVPLGVPPSAPSPSIDRPPRV